MSETTGVATSHIAVLGHIDSGKTLLIDKLVSLWPDSIHSTASQDSNAESKRLGITLDVGFSRLGSDVCLIDCPGHYSLIKTVLIGASLMQIPLLVIDGTKGFQAQTAEATIIANTFASHHLVVALNKCDKIIEPNQTHSLKLMQLEKKLRLFLDSHFSFGTIDVFPVSALTGIGVLRLAERLVSLGTELSADCTKGMPLLLVDHSFDIKGEGHVITGSLLRGMLNKGDTIHMVKSNADIKIKSLQTFRKNVGSVHAGTRVAIKTNKQQGLHQRDIGLSPSTVEQNCWNCLAVTVKVSPLLNRDVKIDETFMICLLNQNCVATLTIFKEMKHDEPQIRLASNITEEQLSVSELNLNSSAKEWIALVKCKQPIVATSGDMFILIDPNCCDSKSSTLINAAKAERNRRNRIVFYGRVLECGDLQAVHWQFKKTKLREGRLLYPSKRADGMYVCTGLFESMGHAEAYLGHSVNIKSIKGRICNTFGTNGKVLIRFEEDIAPVCHGDSHLTPHLMIGLKVTKYTRLGA